MRPGTRAVAVSVWIFSLAVAAAAQDQAPQGSHTDPMCWQEPRVYHDDRPSDLEDMARRQISITRVKQALPKPFTVSPNHAYAFHPPSDTGASRWSFLVAIERPYLLRIEAADAFNLLDLHWITEKLLYFRLWIGRRAGADVIVDVEKEKVIYTEAMEDGAILWGQAHQSCKGWEGTPNACQVTCYPLK